MPTTSLIPEVADDICFFKANMTPDMVFDAAFCYKITASLQKAYEEMVNLDNQIMTINRRLHDVERENQELRSREGL